MAKDFVFVSVTLSHLEWKSGRKRMGPLAIQEVEGREERMEDGNIEVGKQQVDLELDDNEMADHQAGGL